MSVLIDNLTLKSPAFRRSLRTAVAIAIAIFIAQTFNFIKGFWIPMTVLIVMEATIGGTFRKAYHRVLGTLAGVAVDSIILLADLNIYCLFLIFLISVFFAYYLKSYNVTNYGFFAFTMTVMILILYQILLPQPGDYFFPRVYETVLGAVIGIILSLLVLPTRSITLRNAALRKLLVQYKGFIEYQFTFLTQPSNNYCMLFETKSEIQDLLLANQELMRMLRYESFINKNHRRISSHVVFLFERIDHIALSMEIFVGKFFATHFPQDLAAPLQRVIGDVLRAFEILTLRIDQRESDQAAITKESVNHLRDFIKAMDQFSVTDVEFGNRLNCLLYDLKDLIKILRKLEEYLIKSV